MSVDVLQEYNRRFETFLQEIAHRLEGHVNGFLAGVPHIDRVGARAKAPERFAEKITRKDENGKLKYQKPLTELQDLVGARIIVFYKSDVEVVTKIVNKYFRHIEQKEVVPEYRWAFGYFGEHFILALPGDVIPEGVDRSLVPTFFELQVKTLFQHAWSEANHDLGYKSSKALTDDQIRRLAYTSAQAWGADRVFEELWSELCANEIGTPQLKTS